MKNRVFAVLAALVLLVTSFVPASASTQLFHDNFNDGTFNAWTGITQLNNGTVVVGTSTACNAAGFPLGHDECEISRSGAKTNPGPAYVYKDQRTTPELLDYQASFRAFFVTQYDNGSNITIFNARDMDQSKIAIAVESNPKAGGQDFRAKCQKADGTTSFTSWIPKTGYGPFTIGVSLISAFQGLCQISVNDGFVESSASVPLNNNGVEVQEVRLGITGIASGAQYTVYYDDFSSSRSMDTFDLIFADDFDGPEPLSEKWSSTFWSGTQEVPGVPPSKPISCGHYFELMPCFLAEVPEGAYSSGVFLDDLAPLVAQGGIRLQAYMAWQGIEDVPVKILVGYDASFNELFVLEVKAHWANFAWQDDLRFRCKNDDGTWAVEGADGWITDLPHETPYYENFADMFVRVDYKQEPAGSCALTIWSITNLTEPAYSMIIYPDIDGQGNVNTVSFGALLSQNNINFSLHADYFEAYHILP